MKKSVFAVCLVAAAVVGWWLWSRGPAAPPAPVPTTGDAGDPQIGTSVGTSVGANRSHGEAPAAPPTETERTAAEPQAPAGHTWVVRGHVMQRRDERLPGARVRLSCFAGIRTDTTALHQHVVTADADGSFRWALPPPDGTVTITGVGDMPDHTGNEATAFVAAGDAPPQNFELWVSPLDRVVRGTVLDANGRAIPDAWVGTWQEKRPVEPDGSFELAVASPYDQIRIGAGAPGFTSAQQTLQRTEDLDGLSAHFVLQPGFRIRGRVVDEQGIGVGGATVCTFFTQREPVESAADGRFEILHADAARDRHSLFARKPGFVEAKVTVDGRQPEPEYVLELVRGSRVRGSVRGPDGRVVAGARLFLGFSPNAYDRLDAVSERDGTFEFASVGAGTHVLWTRRDGFAPDTRTIEVPDDGTAIRVDVDLGTPHFVAGIVVDEQGRPVAGVRLSALQRAPAAYGMRGGRTEYLDVRARTGPDGTFRLDGLPAGVVDVEAFASDILRLTQSDVSVDRDDLRIVVQRAARIAGRVVDAETGAPVRDFRVHLFRPQIAAGESTITGYSVTWLREGHRFQGEDGAFTTKGEQLADGSIAGVVVTAAGYAQARNERVVASVDPDPDDCIVRLERGGAMRGVVCREADGAPVPNARILFFASEQPERHERHDPEFGAMIRATSAADGSFALDDLPDGPASLQVEVEGLPSHFEKDLVIAAGQTVQRTIRVAMPAGLAGVVLDAERRPIVGAHVTVQAGTSSATVTTDEQGRFETRQPLLAGTATASVATPPGPISYAIRREVTLHAGRTAKVELTPLSGSTVRLTIQGEGTEGAGFVLSLVADGGATRFQGGCSQTTCEVRGVPPGEYMVLCHKKGFWGNTRCTVVAGSPVDVTVTMQKAPF